MKKLLSLLKATMSQDMSLFRIKARNESRARKIVLPIVLALLVMFSVGSYVAILAEELAPSHLTYIVLTIFIMVTSLLTIIEGVYKSQGILFEARDNELLFSLPITQSKIFFIRIFKLITFQFLYNFLFMLPAIIVYAIYEKTNVSFYLISTVMLVLLPIIPTILGCIFGYIIKGLSAKFKARNININNLVKSEKYYKTVINHLTKEVTNSEVTENEFNNYNPGVEVQCVNNFVETQYKKLSITLCDDYDGYGEISVGLLWKMIPSTRAFDVIAVRYVGMTDVDGTQSGRQIWGTNGNYTYVDYDWNGTNINRQDNGFGISMNITNDSTINYLENYIDSSVKFTGNLQWAGASYQHATSNTTLAQSKSYTLAENGKNGVILFTGNIGSKYDNMPGVYAEL